MGDESRRRARTTRLEKPQNRPARHDVVRTSECIDDLRLFAVSQRVIDGGHEIAYVNGGILGFRSDVIAAAVHLAATDSSARQDTAVDGRPVIAALVGVHRWSPAEL